MLLHLYWENVLGSKVKVKILRALCRYPTKRFTVRELARIIETAHTPVLKSLTELQEMNLIRMEKHGTANMITMNSKSHLYNNLTAIYNLEKDTTKQLKEKIKKLIPKVAMIALFGSIAQKMEKAGSDIDLMIVVDDKEKMKDAIDNARREITDEFGNLLSPIILTLSEFKKKKSLSFAQEAMKNYEIILGDDLIKRWWKHD